MLITSSTWCFTIRNSHGLCPPYLLMLYLKTVLYISPIIYQFSDGTLNKYLITWNIWAPRIIYFRLHKSKLQCFGHWHHRAISWGNVGRGYQCVPFQINTRRRGEFIIHGSGKVPGAVGRTWSHAAGCASFKTTRGGKYHKIPFLRERRRGYQVDGWKN